MLPFHLSGTFTLCEALLAFSNHLPVFGVSVPWSHRGEIDRLVVILYFFLENECRGFLLLRSPGTLPDGCDFSNMRESVLATI